MPGPKQRLFFALWPDDELRRRIVAGADAAIRAAGGRPVPPENYHITLAFLGAVSFASVADIVAVCSNLRFGRFALELDRTGYWPRAKIAWLGLADCPRPLAMLEDNLWNALTDLGFQRDHQPYRPHVTLCRQAPEGLTMELAEPIRWHADAFVLAKSEPGEHGPVYTVVEKFHAGD